jgi:hypothetical protein
MIIEAKPWSVDVFQPYVDFCIKEFGVERWVEFIDPFFNVYMPMDDLRYWNTYLL